MKKKILSILLMTVMVFAFTACGGSSEEPAATKPAEEVTYQSILDDYSQQIKDATPGLVEEYKSESADLAGDVEALAELSTSKVEKLAEIETEGTEKMAELMQKNGDEYEVYEEWAGKLYDVYEEYAGQINDAYMDSAI